MDIGFLPSMLAMGFAAGVLHAFDADHLAAVSGLSGSDGKRSVRFALHWGFGHGVAVIIIAAAVIVFGAAIPERFSAFAESAVAWMLILIGVHTFYHLWQQHKGNTVHNGKRSNAMLVGLVHGSAGSAPLLALIPAANFSSPAWGMLHILLFNFGLLLAMLGVGATLRRGLLIAANRDGRLQISLQGSLASFAVGFGVFLLLG